MLESLDQSNIKRMSLEEPEKKVDLIPGFDPEEFFSKTDWEILEKQTIPTGTKVWEKDGAYWNLISSKILSEKHSRQINQQDEEAIMDQLDRSILANNLQFSAWVKWSNILSEDKFPSIPEEVFEEASKRLQECKQREDYRHFLEEAAWLTVLGKRPELTEEDFKNMEADLQKHIRDKYPNYIIEDGAAMAIIFPDYPLEISDESWEVIKELIRGGVGGAEWDAFAAMAKIMSDKCLEVKKQKLELSEPPPNLIPEQRNF